MKTPTTDNLDAELTKAFDRALAGTPADLVESVMRRIRHRQRMRFLVLGLVGTVAAGIALVNGLPLIDTLETVVSQVPFRTWHTGLPAIAMLAAAGIFCGWLLLEEPA